MSGHSEKKAKKAAGSANKIYITMIFISTGIYLLLHFYQYFIKKREDVFSKKEIFDFIFLSLVNYLVYKLLNLFRNSFWDSYLLDLLGLNCLIEILINFSKNFWYLYLIYPAYFLMKGGKYIYGYVSNIGKSDGSEETDEAPLRNRDSGHQTKQVKEKKQKIKYVKH